MVHRKQLADQWVERINQFMGIPKKEIGVYHGAKKKLTGKIDIAVMQSLVKKDSTGKSIVEDWISEYGQIIVDECHHISAESFEAVIRKCPAYYRLGLSATVIRKDGQHPIVLMNLGEVRYQDKRREAANTIPQRVIVRHTDFVLAVGSKDDNGDGKPRGAEIQEVFKMLCQDGERNAFILDDIIGAYNSGRECLVLSERIEHLEWFYEELSGTVKHLSFLKGGMGKKQLAAIMEKIQNVPEGENRVILSTGKYLGEGFDLPCLDTLFLVFPFSWKGTLTQYTGRLNREFYGKKDIQVYDYVDDKVLVLGRMFGRRMKGYRALGFEIDFNAKIK
jgi:superfamily II DNA or RNA helicase